MPEIWGKLAQSDTKKAAISTTSSGSPNIPSDDFKVYFCNSSRTTIYIVTGNWMHKFLGSADIICKKA